MCLYNIYQSVKIYCNFPSASNEDESKTQRYHKIPAVSKLVSKSIIKNAMRIIVKIRGLCRALPVHDAFTFSMDLKPG